MLYIGTAFFCICAFCIQQFLIAVYTAVIKKKPILSYNLEFYQKNVYSIFLTAVIKKKPVLSHKNTIVYSVYSNLLLKCFFLYIKK